LLTTVNKPRRPILLVGRNQPSEMSFRELHPGDCEFINLCFHALCQVCLVRVIPYVLTPLGNFPNMTGECFNTLTLLLIKQLKVSGLGIVSVQDWWNVRESSEGGGMEEDRKSTRLNSSHVSSSYA